ncbi:MAG: ATP-binding protein, partial [Lachnospiraceae bacterium]|nr:ATP-binding protein [Lachnospiraceae bacterium]
MQDKHYMVRLDHRLKKIKEDYVDAGSYFVINKGRQYGKTTTLQALAKYLSDAYIVLSLDFQLLGTEDFTDEMTFSCSLVEY